VSAEAPRARGGRQHIPRPASWRLGGPAPWASSPRLIGSDDVAAALRGREPGRLVPPFPGARRSAVLVVVHDAPSGLEVLFTKRAQHLSNHRGEISFPGGRLEPSESPAEGALREAWEEVGLDPSLVDVLGELDHLSTVVSNSHIVPVVATVSRRPELHPHPGEVDRILWVGLDELAAADTYREEWWGVDALERPIHFFELADETIWGATARMVHQLLRLVHGVDEPEPPAW
jgi:8-oxo-dGTP pyrophosphatase MutT (NUDIX family)